MKRRTFLQGAAVAGAEPRALLDASVKLAAAELPSAAVATHIGKAIKRHRDVDNFIAMFAEPQKRLNKIIYGNAATDQPKGDSKKDIKTILDVERIANDFIALFAEKKNILNRILYGGGGGRLAAPAQDPARKELRAYAAELREALHIREETSSVFLREIEQKGHLYQILRLEEEKARTRYNTLMDIMRNAPAPEGKQEYKDHILEWPSQVNQDNIQQLDLMSDRIAEHKLRGFGLEIEALGKAKDAEICERYDTRIRPLMEAQHIDAGALDAWWDLRDHAPVSQMGAAREKAAFKQIWDMLKDDLSGEINWSAVYGEPGEYARIKGLIEEEVVPVIRSFIPEFSLDVSAEAQAAYKKEADEGIARYEESEKKHATKELKRRQKKIQQEKDDLWPGEEHPLLGRGRGNDIY